MVLHPDSRIVYYITGPTGLKLTSEFSCRNNVGTLETLHSSVPCVEYLHKQHKQIYIYTYACAYVYVCFPKAYI